MIGHRQMGSEDYLAIWRRRRLLILVPAFLGMTTLFIISLVLPARYESETLVIIQRQKIPNTLVQPIITDDLNARIANLEEQVLSRTRLEPIIKRYDLFKADSGQPLELLVKRLRDDITLTPVKPIVRSRDETLPGFTISVGLPTAREAQHVCAEITSMFIEEDLRQREQSTQEASSFFIAQVNEAKRHLDEEDAKLAQFKRKYINVLPDETQTNLNLLSSLDGRLEAVTQALNRAQQDKTYTESLLAQQVGTWKALEAAGVGGVDKPQPQTLDEQLAAKQNTLVTLEAAYTPEHPDIVALKVEIEQLKKKIQSQAATPPAKVDVEAKPSSGEPAQIQQLRNQIHVYDDDIRAETRQQKELQEQIQALQSRIEMTPMVEQQYKEITRDHQMAQDIYNDLLKKASVSAMATDLERRQQGEQFNVMDPANLPQKPSFPNRPLFVLGGLGGGLAVGLCLAWLIEARNKALYNDNDIEACLGLPTLGHVPFLAASRTKQRSRKGRGGSLTLQEGHTEGV